jgi:UDP-glucose 4-epimerase
MGKILLTGGAGYIGSHTALVLAAGGYDVVVADSFRSGRPEAVENAARLAGRDIECAEVDIRDTGALADIMRKEDISCVIHFAGLKSVAESVSLPLEYYETNIGATISLLKAMKKCGVKDLIFSSSASVYGSSGSAPYSEEDPRGSCQSPYAWSKYMIEQILEDAAAADPGLGVIILRYFNPVGAHESGLIGESPDGLPDNLMPRITAAAAGGPELKIFGSDYDTPDGTCLRDYIHVMDLAEGHEAALRYLQKKSTGGSEIFNLGTGRPCSVLELIQTFEKVCGVDVPHSFAPRRPGDLAAVYADCSRAEKILGWQACRTIGDMCRDAWHRAQPSMSTSSPLSNR